MIVEVVKANRNQPGFRVQVQFRPVMEDMFETLVSAARFENIIDANRFAEKLRNERRNWKCFETPMNYFNLDLCWTWSPSRASPFSRLQETPSAVDTFYPTSGYAKNVIAQSDMR